MPLATLAGIPAFIGLHALYSWTHPAPSLGNTFYLNSTAFYLRYAIYTVLWNLLAGLCAVGAAQEATPIAPALSWLSGIGLILLAFSASFASIDWILSLEPTFWSSIFPMIAGAGWFNTGLALVLLVVAVSPLPRRRPSRPHGRSRRDPSRHHHFLGLCRILQFLIIWEENLKSEIPWYLAAHYHVWAAGLFVSAGLGFFVPFFALLMDPGQAEPRRGRRDLFSDPAQSHCRQVVAGVARVPPGGSFLAGYRCDFALSAA